MSEQVGSAEIFAGQPLCAAELANSPNPSVMSRGVLNSEIIESFPVDAVTEVPLAVLTIDTAVPIEKSGKTNSHHGNYFRTHRHLEGTMKIRESGGILSQLERISMDKLGGLAVRLSRTQRLEPELHTILHQRYPIGPEVVTTVSDKFKRAVNQFAGVVPRYAVDVTNSDPDNQVYMSDRMFKEIARPWSIHPEEYCYGRPEGYQKDVLSTFFLRYAAVQDLSHVSPSRIDEFLHTEDQERKLKLSSLILKEGLEVSVEPLMPMHRELRSRGMILQGSLSLREALYGTVSQLAVARVTPLLSQRLAS